MTYTPGPWEWKESEWGDYYNLENAEGVVIHSDGSAAGEYSPDIDVTGDDARLIASAPDLLAACEALAGAVEVYRDYHTLKTDDFEARYPGLLDEPYGRDIHDELAYRLDQARAAITKAKGG